MKPTYALLTALLVLPTVPAMADTTVSAAAKPTMVTPSQLQWVASPTLPAGTTMAVIDGDPTKAGWYTIRLHLPNGTVFPPHFHGDTEYVTVLQGTLMVGIGDTVDKTKMSALPAGSVVTVPAGVHHYAAASGDTILQLTGQGPMTMTVVKSGGSM